MEGLPPAPTPPSNMGQGQNGQHSSNLLNLLKFSGAGQNAAAAAQQARQEPYQQQHQQQHYQHHQPQLEHQHSGQEPQDSYQYGHHGHHGHHAQHQHDYQQQQHQHQHQHQPQQRYEMDEPTMPMPAAVAPQILAPAPAAQDPSGLLRALMGGVHEMEEARQEQAPPSQAPASHAPEPDQPLGANWGASSPPEDTRTYLLNLLNRPKPSQHDQPGQSDQSRNGSFQHAEAPSGDRSLHQMLEAASQPVSQHSQQSNSYDQQERRALEHIASYGGFPGFMQQQQQHQGSPKSYQAYNGYDAQQHSASQNHTPKSGSATVVGQGAAPSLGHSPSAAPFQILRKSHNSPSGSHHGSDRKSLGHERSPLASPEQLRNKVLSSASPADHIGHPTPGSTASFASASHADRHPKENKETVSEAIHDIAEKANQEAQEAVARAEDDKPAQPDVARDIDNLNAARTESEFEDTIQQAAQSIKKELERDENDGVLESVMPASVAEEVHQIVEDAAAEGVADSWESADQDEIVVIEDEAPAPVKVFNFPMKPWISITVLDGPERPQFRDESIMDIARLKKEFDQIDRNLYTATQIYMAYGMSKAGGLRVIRQEDGRDAKIFTETKDRVFNVAMSVTPADHRGVHREAIIGTGISGTVYWVQIRNGEKDHIEDAHPEQYGFALPPMSFHEGDAPGGVLKTRARSSTIHPEFFAVGRGKSINIVWPSYIMKHGLFKPGHDRVVDTDQLAKQCSLKINTGKAGKDFTFSQDDSVIVSLDKSGRVKFWDVRDLTAAKEDGDSSAPLPMHTSMEVKDPMLTLTTTPEGEKAWPTSVLLVDKLRPYQKRGALRYMIVGMKQNHTLQLWDLALGKPVQEFNLPHSKESDAVCSVMYHPPSGVLVIGHPTRNSIYLAHLSAPKYNLKSVSQVDYIQRLVAQDTAIPQPDSTAVISGVREYSFANRGILRSLDILATPAMSQDSDEPTLFELYAMHSKGVACLLIKQTELGWSKDNKVLAPVDAVAAGVIEISKLKTPAAQLPDNNAQQSQQETAPQTPANNRKEQNQSNNSQDESSRNRGNESTGNKAKQESKDDETPAPPAKEEKSEKQERKGRKKKAAAAAAAALAAEQQPQANGGQSPRVGPKDGKGSASAAAAAPAAAGPNSITQESVEAYLGTMESRLNSSFAGTINAALKSLHTKIEDGHRQREKDFDERQMKLLNMVSEVLNENTQKVLESLIQEQFSNSVIPVISDVAGKAVADQFKNSLNNQVSQAIHKEVHKALPAATQHAVGSADFVKSMSDRVAKAVAGNVQHEVVNHLGAKLSANFNNVAMSACQKVADDMERRHRAELEEIKAQRSADRERLDQMNALVTEMSSTMSGMAATQTQLQEELMRWKQQQQQAPKPQQQQHHHHHQSASMSNPASQHSQSVYGQQAHSQQGQPQAYGHQQQMQHFPGPHGLSGMQHMQSPEGSARSGPGYAPSQVPSQTQSHVPSLAHSQQALSMPNMPNVNAAQAHKDHSLSVGISQVEELIREGKIEDAMLRWLQSGFEQQIFERFISQFGPGLLEGLPGLLLLTVATTISQNLDSLTRQRIEWLEVIVNRVYENFGELERDAKAMTPKIFHIIINNTEGLFMRISSSKANDPLLRTLSQMVATAKKTVDLCHRYGSESIHSSQHQSMQSA